MKTTTKINYGTQQVLEERKSESGLTLVESVVSLLIFFVALAGIVPIFLNYTISSINNQRRTAGIAVSQQVLDEIRQSDIALLPAANGTTTTETKPNVTHLGKDYTPRVTYCQDTSYCDARSRHIKIEVLQNGQSVYEAETVFTKFE